MTESKGYFEKIAGEWNKLRAEYFTETMRDAATARADGDCCTADSDGKELSLIDFVAYGR